ncbi:MAG: ATP-binding protein [Planctomycetaceae bacterium]|nr:ATP-binding protein [Planctomycetaceae bacterium]MBK96200.1 ATP-binding protein [Planctomycetaceae bacterium]|tara:strand:- start:984 stop:1664 length:681 start_codon:yes stop_codon:yes gene_type:complete
MAELVIQDLKKEYPTRGEPLEILKGIDLSLNQGDNLAVIGPSGSGKSTLLNVLGTLDHPTSGSYTLNGTDPFALDENELAAFRNANIGFIFQEHHLLPQLSVIENVLIPTMADGKPGSEQIARAEELIERVGLTDRLHHRPAELSGGERERVAVARSLICRPSLVLADEPTGNLDRRNAQQIGELLLEIQQAEEMVLVVVTHSSDLAAMLDQKLEINDGRLSSPKA